MQAIILAGGFGTRLKSMVSAVPKPMAPVNGRPFLSYLLDNLNNYGFQKVVLAVGYQKESIINFYKNRYICRSVRKLSVRKTRDKERRISDSFPK